MKPQVLIKPVRHKRPIFLTSLHFGKGKVLGWCGCSVSQSDGRGTSPKDSAGCEVAWSSTVITEALDIYGIWQFVLVRPIPLGICR